MKRNISDPLLSRVSGLVARGMGLYFPRERWSDLERGILSAAKEFGSPDPGSYINEILSPHPKRNALEVLASCITVGESYFFRDPKIFEVLEREILLPRISGGNRRLRVWCAGCAAGEEAYSIAILINRLIPDRKDGDLSILATDINPRFLGKAAEGCYTEWSFRNAPAGMKENYFRKTQEGRYRISPRIRKMVTFSRHNLAEDPFPPAGNGTGGMDVILCRNVLMYFGGEVQKRVIGKFYDCLAEGGWLLVSPTEISSVLFSDYATVSFPGVTVYRKESARNQKRGDFVIPDAAMVSPDQPWPDGLGNPPAEIFPVGLQDLTVDEAAPAEDKGISAEPAAEGQDCKSLEALARARANEGNLTEALQWCEKAIALDKLNPESHYLRATILQEQDRVEEAISSLQHCLYLNPDFVLAHFTLGNLLRRQGRRKESELHFGNALALVNGLPPDKLIADSEGISAGRLREIIAGITSEEARP